MSAPAVDERRVTPRRKRKVKAEAQIVLLCNPRAGGRWKALAAILDSEEARHVRRIVTDSVEDIVYALSDLGQDVELLCVYGGDGTIQRVLDRLAPEAHERLRLALLGGGTMNVTSRWCGFSRDPLKNFRHVVHGHRSGELLYKEVPILEVRTGDELHRAFTFGMGPIVRLLDSYERGRKGKRAAIGTAMGAISAVWLKRPASYDALLDPLRAEVVLDGERLPHHEFAALFANVTGQINPGVEPFVDQRSRDTFYCAASALSVRELTLSLPFLARGWLPLDVAALAEPGRLLERLRDPKLFTDPRHINRTVSRLEVRSDEPLYTVDGELLATHGGEVRCTIGPTFRLAVGPRRVLRVGT